MIVLSKSIGGGLPLAVLLMKPEMDQWRAGEHTGTFRGNNLAFIAAAELFAYWETDELANNIKANEVIIKDRLTVMAEKYTGLDAAVRGRGMIYGMDIGARGIAGQVLKECFNRNLVIELSGARDNVVKVLPPLVIEEDLLAKGLDIIEESIKHIIENQQNSNGGMDIIDSTSS